jgi:hypothetical protein
MKFFFFLFLFIPLISNSKEIISDKALFRVAEEIIFLSDLQDIEDFIDEKVLSNKTFNYVEIKFATKNNYHLDDSMLKQHDKFKNLVYNPNSPFLERLNIHKKIKSICAGDLGLLHIYESIHGEISEADIEQFVVDNPNYNLEKVNQDYADKYPLLGHMNIYNYQHAVAHIAQYVNMIDKI